MTHGACLGDELTQETHGAHRLAKRGEFLEHSLTCEDCFSELADLIVN